MTVTTGSFPKELAPGLKGRFSGMYNSLNPVWKQLFRVLPSEKKYEEMISTYTTGLVDEKPEGASMLYDDIGQGLTVRHTHKTYGKGVIITEEAQDDNLYGSLANRAVEALVKSHATTEEFVHAGILNLGFTVANNHQEGGDGQFLFDTDHTLKNGTYSNLLTAAALSRTSLEDAITQISLNVDESGVHFSGLNPTKLVVPTTLKWQAMEILKSTLQPETGNNAVNTMDSIIPYVDWRYLDGTSTKAWFVTTDADYGLIHYDRKKPAIRMSNDDDTYNEKIQSRSRYVTGVIDPRGIYGNVGA
jgi:hypothetical protein